MSPLSEDRNSKEWLKYLCHHLYKDINIPIEYTGNVLVGGDFIDEYYIHMDFKELGRIKN